MIKRPLHLSKNEQGKIAKELYLEASFLFVTYNRCPNNNFEYNPLTWAFATLLSNFVSDRIVEWLVLDDGSSDYTEENVIWLSKKYNIDIRFIHYPERKGCSYRRSQGIELLSNDIFFMGDDDCLFREDFIGILLSTWQALSAKDEKISVLASPVLEMRTMYNGNIPKELVGYTNARRAYFCHNFDKRPIVNNIEINGAFQIHIFKGISLGSKSAFISAGNFLDLSFWGNDYSEHLEVAYRLEKSGYSMYYLPNIYASVTHIKWGCDRNILLKSDKSIVFKGISCSLSQIEKLSRKSSQSGCRVGDTEFVLNRIGSFLAFYLKVSLESASTYAVIEYENIVNNKRIIDIIPEIEKLPVHIRKELWLRGVSLGMKFAQRTTGLSYESWYNNLMDNIKRL